MCHTLNKFRNIVVFKIYFPVILIIFIHNRIKIGKQYTSDLENRKMIFWL